MASSQDLLSDARLSSEALQRVLKSVATQQPNVLLQGDDYQLLGPMAQRMVRGQITKAASGQLQSVENRGGWWPIIREPYAGAWQRNAEITVDNVTTHATVFACATLTASDIAKMRLRLVQQDADGIWTEVESASFSPVLRKPNHYQNRIQFITSWILSKQLWGNTYVLKVRDQRRVVVAMYVLDPSRTRPLVAPNGDVYYELKRDDLSLQPEDAGVIVPASEIIHDRQNTLFHPLVGLSPIYACGLAAVQGLNIQNNSTILFANGSLPGGVITAPGPISQLAADRVKDKWDTSFAGDNIGKVAVLGDGMEYEAMTFNAVDSQLIEQLRWTAENVAVAFKVPYYMVGGPPPNYNNIEALSQQYYTQGQQILAESLELCLDDGLGLTEGDIAQKRYGTEFDIDDLLRMDSATMMKTISDGVKAGVMSPNEGRLKLNMKPVEGGDTPYLQVQNFSLSALNKRDQAGPPVTPGVVPVAAKPVDDSAEPAVEDVEKEFVVLLRKEMDLVTA